MDLIIDFYKGLDTLNLIIFWGIIVVIVLLLIFSFILINKNKKLKKMVEDSNKYEEEIPIKEDLKIEKVIEPVEEKKEAFIHLEEEIPDKEKDIITTQSEIEKELSKPIEVENNFVVEEHIVGYNKENNNTPNIEKNAVSKTEITKNEFNFSKPIEIPNKPYQRNVLREMSLSQTSPIGINRQVQTEDRKKEMIKDLEEILNNEELTKNHNKEMINEIKTINTNIIDNEIKEELKNVENKETRKTEIIQRIKENKDDKNQKINDFEKTPHQTKLINNKIENNHKEILKNLTVNKTEEQKSSEKYLEEVSRKLAEAEIPDEVERTNYELQQEEDAIISYTELMEKKDTIQTVDEEDAVISIEELMNRTTKQNEQTTYEQKMYNLTEEEANDSFIKELKQFRNDL